MPGETPQNQLNPQEFDPSLNAAASIPSHEALRLGAQELAGNLVQVAELNDPSAIKDYLNDLVSETDNSHKSAAERSAAFSFLATEQRSEIRRGLVSSGEQMLDNMDRGSTKVQEDLSRTGSSANSSIRAVTETHQREVGRYFRDRVDTRGAARGHEVTSQTAKQGYGALTRHTEGFDGWAKAQQSQVGEFNKDLKQASDHEHALDEAELIASPDYEGDQKDLSAVIDEEVKGSAAAKLLATITDAQESGKPPEEAVVDLLTKESDGSTLKLIGAIREFADQYADKAKAGSLKVGGLSRESERLLKVFVSRGNDGYRYLRRSEEAIDLYKQQRNTLSAATGKAQEAISRGGSVFTTAQQERQRMRQMVVNSQDLVRAS